MCLFNYRSDVMHHHLLNQFAIIKHFGVFTLLKVSVA